MNIQTIHRERIDLATGALVREFAICCSEPTPECPTYSLAFEGYRSAWQVGEPREVEA